MKKLIRDYNFENEQEYYSMVFESYVNGQRKQAITQIKAMPKENRKELVKYVAALQNNEFNETLDWFMEQAIG